MLSIIYALLTVLAWGIWLAPSQNIPLKDQRIRTFYVASINLVLALAVTLPMGLGGLTFSLAWPPFVGGLIWSVSGVCAFTATKHMGMARASGMWSSLNIIVSLIMGWLLFGEFRQASALTLQLLALAITGILAGVLLIVFAKAKPETGQETRKAGMGLLCGLGAGILWGVYFLPIKMSGVNLWLAALPMAAGIFAGSSALLLLNRVSLKLEQRSHYLRLGATGVLWTTGNYGMLLLVDSLGAGKGYTIAQLALVLNALVGVFILKDPKPNSRAAWLTLLGCGLATGGGILLGNLK